MDGRYVYAVDPSRLEQKSQQVRMCIHRKRFPPLRTTDCTFPGCNSLAAMPALSAANNFSAPCSPSIHDPKVSASALAASEAPVVVDVGLSI